MNEFSIIFPRTTSGYHGYLKSDGNKEIRGSKEDLPKLLGNIKDVSTLYYETPNGVPGHTNFSYAHRNSIVGNRVYQANYGEDQPGLLGIAKEERLKRHPDIGNVITTEGTIEQFIDPIKDGGQRKMTGVAGCNNWASSGLRKNQYVTIQTVLPNGDYKVITKDPKGNIIRGYKCNLNAITNTAEVYDRTAQAFVKEVKENGSKTLSELLKKAKL